MTGTRKSTLTGPEKRVLARARKIGLDHAAVILLAELQRRQQAGFIDHADAVDEGPTDMHAAFDRALQHRPPMVTKTDGANDDGAV